MCHCSAWFCGVASSFLLHKQLIHAATAALCHCSIEALVFHSHSWRGCYVLFLWAVARLKRTRFACQEHKNSPSCSRFHQCSWYRRWLGDALSLVEGMTFTLHNSSKITNRFPQEGIKFISCCGTGSKKSPSWTWGCCWVLPRKTPGHGWQRSWSHHSPPTSWCSQVPPIHPFCCQRRDLLLWTFHRVKVPHTFDFLTAFWHLEFIHNISLEANFWMDVICVVPECWFTWQF